MLIKLTDTWCVDHTEIKDARIVEVLLDPDNPQSQKEKKTEIQFKDGGVGLFDKDVIDPILQQCCTSSPF